MKIIGKRWNWNSRRQISIIHLFPNGPKAYSTLQNIEIGTQFTKGNANNFRSKTDLSAYQQQISNTTNICDAAQQVKKCDVAETLQNLHRTDIYHREKSNDYLSLREQQLRRIAPTIYISMSHLNFNNQRERLGSG